ncbi:hypothetical protein QFC20_000551 [Naganishia adeliensis]|uniref:Uncharacterized protein n=1 Tax=Naganishia adeliensis TaxID=92952 RepID=A0ACC2WXW1_9TREE|nr:hypothetical protein QFC20_000551 [Naganishia adeliensis]
MSSFENYKGPYNPKPRPLPDGEAYISIYNYVPSLALGALAAALFAVAFVGHTYLFVRGRGIRWFQGLMAFGSAMEVVGYGFRIKSHGNPFLVIPFVIQYFFIVCAPVFFAAALYLSLQYAINLNPANLQVSPVKKAFVTSEEIPETFACIRACTNGQPALVFIVIDSVTTVIQIVGAALIGVASSKDSRGEETKITSAQANNILLAGLSLQCASFLVFLAILTTILLRLRNHAKYPKATSSQLALTRVDSSNTSDPTARGAEKTSQATYSGGHTYTKTFLVILYVTSLLIFLRTVYRLAETAEGVWGTASSYEWLFGLLEFAPVILAVLMWLARPLMVEMRRMGMNGGVRGGRNTV